MDNLRKEISKIDDEIIALFEKRMGLAKEIASYKRGNFLEIRDPKREEEIIARLEGKISNELKFTIQPLYEEIFALSRYYQRIQGKIFGLVGKNLSHSKSPQIHKNFGYDYELFDLDEGDLDSFMKEKNFSAINVTIPYKIKVMDYLDEIDSFAKDIGSVNTIVNNNGHLTGYNTDYQGLKHSLDLGDISLAGKKVLILGSGGASKTAQALAKNEGASDIRIISRSGKFNYNNLEESKDFQILINATPVGMYPNNLESKVDLGIFSDLEGVVDLIYNPLKTKVILEAEDQGLKTATGLPMLVSQGFYAAQYFTSTDLPPSLLDSTYSKIYKDMVNLVLIGMPGSGKTSLGKALGEKLDKKFIDIDEEIEKESGISAGNYILKYGEEAFRKIESKLVVKYGKESGLILSTGGGAILKKENRLALRQNGYIIYTSRKLENLEKSGRPLSKDFESIKRLYAERKNIYEESSDMKIDIIEGDIDQTTNIILKGLTDEFTSNRRA